MFLTTEAIITEKKEEKTSGSNPNGMMEEM